MIKIVEKDMAGPNSCMNKGFPVFERKGVINATEEMTPFVFKGKLYRLENVDNKSYAGGCKDEILKGATTSFAIIREVESRKIISKVGAGEYFYSLYTENDKVYVFGTVSNNPSGWHGGNTVVLYESDDLFNWTKKELFKKEDWLMFNTSVTKDDDGYALLVELQKPVEIVGPHHFTYMFAKSKDLINWEWLDTKTAYPQDRYAGGPKMHYLNGYYYVFAVTELPGPVYCTYLTRTKDFLTWQFGKYNPFMLVNNDDMKVSKDACDDLTEELRAKVPHGFYISHSDLDFCEYNGKVILDYSIGDQRGRWAFNCEAIYHGTLQEMLENFFD